MYNIIHNLKLNYITTFANQDFKILGIDYGSKKIGIAIFHNAINNVIPLGIAVDVPSPLKLVAQLVQEYRCIAVVIGITKNSHIAKSVLKLQKAIEIDLGIPVLLEDETLTTFTANEILKDMGIKRERRSKIDDAIAANLILESFICDLRQYIHTNKKD